MHKLQSCPPDEDIRMLADEDDIRQWRAYIRGPPDTPYAGGACIEGENLCSLRTEDPRDESQSTPPL